VAVSLFTVLLWLYAGRRDPEGLLTRIEEPREGSPLDIRVGGRLVSQDLANSVLEYYSVLEAFRPGPGSEVCELGAGYGRTAYVFLRASGCRYTVIDIPPALRLAEHYLSSVLPEKKVFRFRPFERFEDVREEFDSAELRFLLPHQAAMLPPRRFDLFLNISSLHEMTPEQIAAYFRLIDRLTRGVFFTKQWSDTVNDANRVRLRREDYPVPAHWRTLFDRRCRVQTRFFEAAYEVGPGGV
jgi:putative sugar O-methyltransferase